MDNPIEQRREPRYQTSLNATIESMQDQTLAVKVRNISRTGMQLIIGNDQLPVLMPNISRDHNQPIQVTIKVQLPEQPIEIQCNILYFNRETWETSSVGCHFIKISDAENALLSKFIQALSQA
jgi:c-di-GMP-binding flagellar brake protein YcgR